MELIFSDVTWREVKFKILGRKTRTFLLRLAKIFLKPLYWIGRFIAKVFKKVYTNYAPKKKKIRKIVKLIIGLCCLLIAAANVILYFTMHKIYILSIIASASMIPFYFVAKLLLILYSYFIGDYQLQEQALYYTKLYIINFMRKLLKIFAETGGGKDTFMTAAAITLSEHFNNQTLQDMKDIQEICYIFDFDKLNAELLKNYKKFLSFSKIITEANFIGTQDEPGLALYHQLFLKKYYIKTKQITPEKIVSDYYQFKEDPIHHVTDYATGIGVSRKHYLQLILEEYIQWFIRINIEKNFIISNQPLVENLEEGIMAREFSFNFLKTKKIKSDKPILDPKTKKRKIQEEKVYFPWKDRLILMETECGTWWSNKDGETGSELTASGIRDFKAYQRHFMKDFYWFQVDQASDRTQKLFRELDHGYARILSRKEIEGGKKKNLFLNLILSYYQRKLKKMENRTLRTKQSQKKHQQKFEDLQNLFNASSNPKYKNKLEKLKRKYTPKEYKIKYYIYQQKVSKLKNKILRNKKDGYIVLEICMSPAGASPSEYYTQELKDIISKDHIPATFVGRFVFKTKDCERYDTRYLRNLAEKKAQETEIVFAQVRRWNKNLKMETEDVKWMAYSAGNDMYGITEEEINDMKYFDGYKEYMEEV